MVGGEKRPVTLPWNTGAAGDPEAPCSPGFAPSSHDVPDESVRIVLQGTSTAPAEPAPAPHINALTASAAAKRVLIRAAIRASCRAERSPPLNLSRRGGMRYGFRPVARTTSAAECKPPPAEPARHRPARR